MSPRQRDHRCWWQAHRQAPACDVCPSGGVWYGYRSVMQPETRLSDEAREELRRELIDKDSIAARMRYVTDALALIINIGDWLAIDSWLGGGKVNNTDLREEFGQAFSEFRAVSTVVCMAAELAEAAVEMAKKSRYYAVAAVTRQLIECEYLLTLFNDDLEHARQWRETTPDEVRRSFTPQRMRKLTGFADEEYWNHCSTGGHPAPRGARLLEKLDPARRSWPYSAELLIDLGLHLRRIWKALDALLIKHHARYGRVRSDERRQAEEAWSRWLQADPVVEALTEAWSGSLSKCPSWNRAVQRAYTVPQTGDRRSIVWWTGRRATLDRCPAQASLRKSS
jgi:hypothetical protein